MTQANGLPVVFVWLSRIPKEDESARTYRAKTGNELKRLFTRLFITSENLTTII